MTTAKKKEHRIKVLVVDSSSVARTLITKMLAEADMDVVGAAPDPYVAREKLVALRPDVMTLDLELPRMSGLEFLDKVMRYFSTPTVVLSSTAQPGSDIERKALALGAKQILAKPSEHDEARLIEIQRPLVSAVKAAAFDHMKAEAQADVERRHSKTPVKSSGNVGFHRANQRLLAIASSTGGTEALKVLFAGLPRNLPATVIVQHMPPAFTRSFAEHLAQLSGFDVKEAEDGDLLAPGRVLLAPGDYHMEVARKGLQLAIVLHQKPLLHGVRPSADYLMRSVAQHSRANAIGVVLTGMGRDGADGLLEMRKAGAFTLAQDEASCVVYGMPKAAVEAGGVSQVIALERMAVAIQRRIK
jgi:two-component system chemotaxis response regulator CheB